MPEPDSLPRQPEPVCDYCRENEADMYTAGAYICDRCDDEHEERRRKAEEARRVAL